MTFRMGKPSGKDYYTSQDLLNYQARQSSRPDPHINAMPQTISEAIGYDHKAIESDAENIKNAATLDEKIEWRNQFTWALARHAVSEELTMYPAMEKHMGQEGLDLTNVDREQHQAVSPSPLRIKSALTSS